MCRLVSTALFLSTLLLISISSAQQTASTAVPNLIRYGGTLKDSQNAAISSTTVGVTFAIYRQQDGGAPVWQETQNVTLDTSGNYSVLLGSTTATGLPSDLFSQEEQRWLGVQVQGQAEQPRVLLVSVPYAFRAHDAETLAGKSISDFVLAKDSNSTNAVTGAASNCGTGSAQAAAGQNNGNSASRFAASQGPTNFSGSTTDQIVKVTQSGTGLGISATASSNAVVGTSPGTGAYAVYGVATGSAGIGVKGTSNNTSGTGVRGINGAPSGATTGVSAQVASAAGTAGVFNNLAGGKILSGQNNGREMFNVAGSGNVTSLGTLAGNVIDSTTTYQISGQTILTNGNGVGNMFLGANAGVNNVPSQGTNNTFLGEHAGYLNTTGNYNTFVGAYAGWANTTGSTNVFYGTFTGQNNPTGNNNIYIGSEGLDGESSTIRIGGEDESGYYPQTAAYISGIYGSTVDHNGIPVYVDDNGQLGTVVSSRRFKEQISDMGDSTRALMRLRPVTFLYKPEYSKGNRTLQYGLIAEEVARVYPELVAYDKDGQPYTVRYQYLASMLLNEVQKQYRRAEMQAQVITAQQQQIESLQEQNQDFQQRLLRLESLIGTPVRAAEDRPQPATVGPGSAQ